MLAALSLVYRDSSEAMVAQVESEVAVISYPKAVRVSKLYVVPGQDVKKGDLLLEVERPDLKLDLEKKENDLNRSDLERTAVIEGYNSDLSLLEAEITGKIERLQSEKIQIQTGLEVRTESKERLSQMIGVKSLTKPDTVTQVKLNSLDQEINSLRTIFSREQRRLSAKKDNELQLLSAQEVILNKELSELRKETSQLVRRSEFDGTIGNVYVQMNELVPPYNRIISVYNSRPSVIKAYSGEREVTELSIGKEVTVKSTNRTYSIDGVITEIGSRVTAYPDKISPVQGQKYYGQEIFIEIPEENQFLNGEKVYVYVKNN